MRVVRWESHAPESFREYEVRRRTRDGLALGAEADQALRARSGARCSRFDCSRTATRHRLMLAKRAREESRVATEERCEIDFWTETKSFGRRSLFFSAPLKKDAYEVGEGIVQDSTDGAQSTKYISTWLSSLGLLPWLGAPYIRYCKVPCPLEKRPLPAVLPGSMRGPPSFWPASTVSFYAQNYMGPHTQVKGAPAQSLAASSITHSFQRGWSIGD